jgi:hypothetical protein
MLTTPHVITGLAIMKLSPNPWVGLLMAFLSHFILDFFVPHWNPHLFTEHSQNGRLSKSTLIIIAVDGLLALTALGAVSFFAYPDTTRIAFYFGASLAATLPDLVEVPYYFLNCKNKLLASYVNFEHHNQAKEGIILGSLTQIIIITAGLKQLFF